MFVEVWRLIPWLSEVISDDMDGRERVGRF